MRHYINLKLSVMPFKCIYGRFLIRRQTYASGERSRTLVCTLATAEAVHTSDFFVFLYLFFGGEQIMVSETGVGYAPWNRPWYVQAAGVIIGSAVVGPPRGPTGPPWGRAPLTKILVARLSRTTNSQQYCQRFIIHQSINPGSWFWSTQMPTYCSAICCWK